MPLSERRAFRFKLRTLMACILAMSMALAYLVARINEATRERTAITMLEQCGAVVRFSYEYDAQGYAIEDSPPGYSWIRKLLGECIVSNVVAVSIAPGSNVTDDDLIPLSCFSDLRELNVQYNPITDRALIHINTALKLEVLNLSGTEISDRGLKHLKPLAKLQWLSLHDTAVTDCGLWHLQAHFDLITLCLADTNVTDDGLKYLIQLKNLDPDQANS